MITIIATAQITLSPACMAEIWPHTDYVANGRSRRRSTRSAISSRIVEAFGNRSLTTPGAIRSYLLTSFNADPKRKDQLRREFTPKIQAIWNSGKCRPID
jgi:hypothetical protein